MYHPPQLSLVTETPVRRRNLLSKLFPTPPQAPSTIAKVNFMRPYGFDDWSPEKKETFTSQMSRATNEAKSYAKRGRVKV